MNRSIKLVIVAIVAVACDQSPG